MTFTLEIINIRYCKYLYLSIRRSRFIFCEFFSRLFKRNFILRVRNFFFENFRSRIHLDRFLTNFLKILNRIGKFFINVDKFILRRYRLWNFFWACYWRLRCSLLVVYPLWWDASLGIFFYEVRWPIINLYCDVQKMNNLIQQCICERSSRHLYITFWFIVLLFYFGRTI